MYRYTLYCTRAQTKKALELGAPISYTTYTGPDNESDEYKWFADGYYAYTKPTAEQITGWLEEQGFRFEIEFTTMYCVMIHINNTYIGNPICANSRKEATMAAIDAALKYLSNNKK